MTRHQVWKIAMVTMGSAIGVVASANLATAASFQGLGDLSGGAANSQAWGISSDGSIVVGYGTSNNGKEAFIWNANTNSMQGISDLPGGDFASEAFGVSQDSKVVGSGSSSNGTAAIIWDETNGMQEISGLEGFDLNRARAVSADGKTVVGSRQKNGHFPEAFIWNETNGLQLLGDLSGGSNFSRASGVSSDGRTVVGASSSDRSGNDATEAFIWNAANGLQGLGDLSGGAFNSRAFDVSASGKIVVGYGSSGNGIEEAFIWRGGTMQGLGDLSGGAFNSRAYGVSADGKTVIGYSEGSNGFEAFIWNRKEGLRSLQSVLTNDFDLDLSGWTLHEARGISDDGLTIVGYGTNPEGKTEAWIASLPAEVPEPSMLLSTLTFGLVAWRQRRKSA